MPGQVYARAKYAVAGGLGWPTGPIRALLLGPSYSFSYAHEYVADLLAHEYATTGYARQTLVGRNLLADIGGDRAVFRSSSIVFPLLSGGAGPAGCAIYKRGGVDDSTPADDLLLFYFALPPTVLSGVDYVVEFVDSEVAVLVNP